MVCVCVCVCVCVGQRATERGNCVHAAAFVCTCGCVPSCAHALSLPHAVYVSTLSSLAGLFGGSHFLSLFCFSPSLSMLCRSRCLMPNILNFRRNDRRPEQGILDGAVHLEHEGGDSDRWDISCKIC